MSENEIQSHVFGPKDRGGIVFGLRPGQIAVLTAGLIVMTSTARVSASVLGAMLGLLVFTGAIAVAFFPVKRRTLDRWLPIFASYANRSLSGHTRWLSKAHLGGHLARMGDLLPPRDQPPGLKGVEILGVSLDEGAEEAGVLKDGKFLVGFLSANGPGFALMDHEDQSRLGNAWASIIGSYGIADSLVRRIGFIERAVPEDPGALRAYALEKIPELAGCRTEEEVEGRLRGLDERRANHIRDYLAGVELTGPAAQQHECYVGLLVDTGPKRVARQLKRIGRGDVVRGAAEVMMRAVADLEERLQTTMDMQVHGMLTPRLLAEVIRTHYYPPAARKRTKLEQAGAPEGQHPANAWPRAFAEFLDHVQSDGACHTTYHIVEFPRQAVPMTFLAPLLLNTKAARTVAMVMEPVDPLKAGREIDATHLVRNITRRAREHYGFESTFRQESEDEKVAQVAREHAAGHVNILYSAYVTVTADTREELDWAAAEVETQIAQSQLEAERLWGQQGPALTYTMPLLRGLAA